jgi:type II secretion system protein H
MNISFIKGTGNTRQGFTLIELLVVLFILALMAGIIMPSFMSPSGTLKKEAAKMASLMRTLYDATVSRKKESKIEFHFKDKVVKWEGPSKSGSMKLETLKALELPSRGMVKEGQLIVFLSPSGGNEHMTIHFGHKEETLSVSFNPISGRTRVNVPQSD